MKFIWAPSSDQTGSAGTDRFGAADSKHLEGVRNPCSRTRVRGLALTQQSDHLEHTPVWSHRRIRRHVAYVPMGQSMAPMGPVQDAKLGERQLTRRDLTLEHERFE